MNLSGKREGLKDSKKRLEEKPKTRATTTANSIPCAFHPTETITNFCTNAECLLPLCPKCIKIHTEEHVKMGN